tara:strand:+ start:11021 stop:11785 length:765 start_codon:yes stop_codon:yes gene_type:complete
MALFEDNNMISVIVLVMLICGLIGYIVYLLNQQVKLSSELEVVVNKLDADVNTEMKTIEDQISTINAEISKMEKQCPKCPDVSVNVDEITDNITKKMKPNDDGTCPPCVCDKIDENKLYNHIENQKTTCPNLEEIVRGVFPGRGTPGFTVYGEYYPLDDTRAFNVEPAYSQTLNEVSSNMGSYESTVPEVGSNLETRSTVPLTSSKAPFDTADNQRLAERSLVSEDIVPTRVSGTTDTTDMDETNEEMNNDENP